MLAAATDSVRVVAVFASTLGDICDGQLREMFHAHRLDQTREEYERRIFGKTASLFAGAAEMGAILGRRARGATSTRSARYGADLGMAFQIVDDVLDLTGGTEDLGKPAGNDLRQGTVTLPTMLYAGSLAESSTEWTALAADRRRRLDSTARSSTRRSRRSEIRARSRRPTPSPPRSDSSNAGSNRRRSRSSPRPPKHSSVRPRRVMAHGCAPNALRSPP